MHPNRLEKFKRVVRQRQPDLAVVLENVHDPHNLGAVLRSCDAVGIQHVFILYTEPHLRKDRVRLGKRTSAGARKWLDIHFYTDVDACVAHLRRDFDMLVGTKLTDQSQSIYDLDLTQRIALVFGNEHAGISDELQRHMDGNFLIPQAGMVQSLNISVACAICVYEAYRQRMEDGRYTDRPTLDEAGQAALLADYTERHENRIQNREVPNAQAPTEAEAAYRPPTTRFTKGKS